MIRLIYIEFISHVEYPRRLETIPSIEMETTTARVRISNDGKHFSFLNYCNYDENRLRDVRQPTFQLLHRGVHT